MEENIKKAWEIMEEKGVSIGERTFIRSAYASTYKDDFPFITCEYKKGKVDSYRSELPEIKTLVFQSEKEVNLANSMVLAMGDKFEINEFTYQLKMVLRILQIDSVWTK